MSEKSWASLAPLLDNRRYVESIVAGVKIKAHQNFRLVTTMNDDASTFELPEYIHSRLQPQILIDFPEKDEEFQILKENLPFAEDRILQYVTDFLRAGACRRRALQRARRHQHRALCHQAEEPGHGPRARDARRSKRRCSRRWARRLCAMPGETGPSLPDFGLDFGSLSRGRFTYLPVVPGRLEFAVEVRRRILAERPDSRRRRTARDAGRPLSRSRSRGCRRSPSSSITTPNTDARSRSRQQPRSMCR